MSREIKFRAWDKAVQSHWRPAPLGMIEFYLHNVPSYIGHTFNENSGVWERRFVVMQYTGLKDKNGVEIYEGDIIANRYDRIMRDVVFEQGAFDCEGLWLNEPSNEVIGNIHENPELLEKTE